MSSSAASASENEQMSESSRWNHALEELDQANLRRWLRTVTSATDRTVRLDGREVLNFSSNSYLGLANHPALVEAAIAAMTQAGFGSGASRLIVGNHELHERLEDELAAFHECEAARLFNSGYNANIGVLQSLATRGDVILSDALNHASIIDGCRLSRAEVVVYPHLDVAALGELLHRYPNRRKLVVTDSVFSMDGDRAPLRELAARCQQAGALLMVDEAHAMGALGPNGRGVAAELGVVPDIRVGTLGKSFGSFGAYVAGSRALVELLLNKARSFVFTTSLPVAVVAATRASLEVVRGPEGHARRARLEALIKRFRDGLFRIGLLAPGAGTTPIFPIAVAEEGQVMMLCEELLGKSIYAQGIRPPTVPRGTSRLRFALMATHTESDIDRALVQLGEMARRGMLQRRP